MLDLCERKAKDENLFRHKDSRIGREQQDTLRGSSVYTPRRSFQVFITVGIELIKFILKPPLLTSCNEDRPHAQEKMEGGKRRRWLPSLPNAVEQKQEAEERSLTHTFGIYQEQKQHWLKNTSFFFFSPGALSFLSCSLLPWLPRGTVQEGQARLAVLSKAQREATSQGEARQEHSAPFRANHGHLRVNLMSHTCPSPKGKGKALFLPFREHRRWRCGVAGIHGDEGTRPGWDVGHGVYAQPLLDPALEKRTPLDRCSRSSRLKPFHCKMEIRLNYI